MLAASGCAWKLANELAPSATAGPMATGNAVFFALVSLAPDALASVARSPGFELAALGLLGSTSKAFPGVDLAPTGAPLDGSASGCRFEEGSASCGATSESPRVSNAARSDASASPDVCPAAVGTDGAAPRPVSELVPTLTAGLASTGTAEPAFKFREFGVAPDLPLPVFAPLETDLDGMFTARLASNCAFNLGPKSASSVASPFAAFRSPAD